MPAKATDEFRMARRHRIQNIANMHALDRARRALDVTAAGLCKGNHRPVQAILEAGGDNPDHAFMPFFVKQAQAHRQTVICQLHAVD